MTIVPISSDVTNLEPNYSFAVKNPYCFFYSICLYFTLTVLQHLLYSQISGTKMAFFSSIWLTHKSMYYKMHKIIEIPKKYLNEIKLVCSNKYTLRAEEGPWASFCTLLISIYSNLNFSLLLREEKNRNKISVKSWKWNTLSGFLVEYQWVDSFSLRCWHEWKRKDFLFKNSRIFFSLALLSKLDLNLFRFFRDQFQESGTVFLNLFSRFTWLKNNLTAPLAIIYQ